MQNILNISIINIMVLDWNEEFMNKTFGIIAKRREVKLLFF